MQESVIVSFNMPEPQNKADGKNKMAIASCLSSFACNPSSKLLDESSQIEECSQRLSAVEGDDCITVELGFVFW